MPFQAAERLQHNTEKIMKQWEKRARKEVAVASSQESLVLQNSLPEFLCLLKETLFSTITKDEARLKAGRLEGERIGKAHGLGRANILGYTLSQLISEYHILRQVIFDVLEQEGPITPVAKEIIISLIEQGVNEAATNFSEALLEMQERLSDALTHDLRGPIAAARINAQLILKYPDREGNCIKMANKAVSKMDRLDAMIRDLLDASRLKAGQTLPLRLSETSLDLIARQTADEFNLNYDNRVRLKSSEPCIGFWDESGLRRIFENLVTNAVKYGAPDTPITIGIEQAEDQVTLMVHNEGHPIPLGDQANLFQAFRRRAPDARQAGWGLGLALVKGIAEAHHGRVWVESEKGAGTTFKVQLPRGSRDLLVA